MSVAGGTKRDGSYIWPTWITPLLSGESHCEWRAWFKAHYKDYPKREDDDPNRLSQWKAEHAEFVGSRAQQLREAGYVVSVENQNKFNVKGATATVGGVMDIVARKPGAVLIEDCKGGKKREEHFWQVVIYMVLGRMADIVKPDEVVTGSVVYRDLVRPITQEQANTGAALVAARIRTTGGAAEPARTPSFSECRFCDIAGCPDRMATTPNQGRTEDF